MAAFLRASALNMRRLVGMLAAPAPARARPLATLNATAPVPARASPGQMGAGAQREEVTRQPSITETSTWKAGKYYNEGSLLEWIPLFKIKFPGN